MGKRSKYSNKYKISMGTCSGEELKRVKILVTGSKGFVGKNLVENLKNIKDGKNRTRPGLTITEINENDKQTENVILCLIWQG